MRKIYLNKHSVTFNPWKPTSQTSDFRHLANLLRYSPEDKDLVICSYFNKHFYYMYRGKSAIDNQEILIGLNYTNAPTLNILGQNNELIGLDIEPRIVNYGRSGYHGLTSPQIIPKDVKYYSTKILPELHVRNQINFPSLLALFADNDLLELKKITNNTGVDFSKLTRSGDGFCLKKTDLKLRDCIRDNNFAGSLHDKINSFSVIKQNYMGKGLDFNKLVAHLKSLLMANDRASINNILLNASNGIKGDQMPDFNSFEDRQ